MNTSGKKSGQTIGMELADFWTSRGWLVDGANGPGGRHEGIQRKRPLRERAMRGD